MMQSNTFPEFVKSRSVDGLIILNYIKNRNYLFEMRRLGLPIVLIDDVLDSAGFNWIYPDYRNGTRQIMQYLVALGHRKIGLIDGPIEYIFNRDRYDGYRELLAERGMGEGRELLEYVEEFSLEEGYQAARRLLGRERGITAVFCACDDLAIGALRAAQEMEYRVPQDLSIVGFDDLEVSQYLNPPLTTVRTPRETIGRLAIEVITKQAGLKGRHTEDGRFTIPVELVIRGSCAAPNSGDPSHTR
jgi:DNA-binding LacI/PurR family transcriptional regulator